MGKMINGVYTPSYGDILQEKFKLREAEKQQEYIASREKRAVSAEKRAVSAEERAVSTEKRAIDVDTARADYWKAKAFNEKMAGGKTSKKPFTGAEWEQFCQIIQTGMLKLAEDFGRRANIIGKDEKISKVDGGYKIGDEVLPDSAVMIGSGVNTKEDAEKMSKQQAAGYNKLSGLMKEYSSDLSSRYSQREKRIKSAQNELNREKKNISELESDEETDVFSRRKEGKKTYSKAEANKMRKEAQTKFDKEISDIEEWYKTEQESKDNLFSKRYENEINKGNYTPGQKESYKKSWSDFTKTGEETEEGFGLEEKVETKKVIPIKGTIDYSSFLKKEVGE